MNRRTVLVTGASGVVGSALLRVLDGPEVISLVHHKPVPGAWVRGDVTRAWLGLDPRDYRDLAARIDVVVHCAASVDFGAAQRTLHRLNVGGVGHVLRFVADAHARLVHVSTAFVGHAARDDIELGTYAGTKARGETLVRESGIPAAIARISTVVGDSATGHIARLQAFHYLLGAALRGLVPFMPCEPGTRADLVPQDLVASALAAMATTEIGDGEYWITAGAAALPLERIISIAGDVAAERLRRDSTAPKIYLPAFLPRIVRPQTYRQVMAMLLANAGPDSRPSGLANLDRLIACYHAEEPFPTSFDLLPDGPPAPTEPSIEKALIATCHHLASLPKEHWNMY